MSTNWTDEQLSAVYARDCNLLVSAAAGAGKTAVLVERIIQKILDQNNPTDIDRLLVVTFTKAAAAEMRDRISSAIARELNDNPASRHLNRQLALLNRASITTLHSFCLEVLRQYFYRIDLDPAFRVADDTEVGLMRLEALDEVFESCYEAGDSDFLTLVDSYGGDRNDLFLQEMVLKLYEFASSNPWPAQWLAGLAGSYRDAGGIPLGEHPWGKSLLDWMELQLQGCLTKLEGAIRLTNSPGGPAVYLENLRDDNILLNDLLNAVHHSWENAYLAFSVCKFIQLKRCADKTVDDNLKSAVKQTRDEVKKTVMGLKTSFFFREPGELAADLHKVAPIVETLTRLVNDFTEKYLTAKQAKGLVDFADLEHHCLKILLDNASSPDRLVPSPAALEIRERFDEILVDEYQDINAVQEAILHLVSRDTPNTPNRFMVGDVKQSIYRFRLADPTLFMEKYRHYPREQAGPNLGIDLTMNFRSRPEVIDAVNYVFRQLMTPRVGEITYDNKAELVSGARYAVPTELIQTAAGPVEVYLLEKSPAGEIDKDSDEEMDDGDGISNSDTFEDNHEDLQEPDSIQREARLVAGRISKMVSGAGDNKQPEFFVHDKNNGYRPVQFRDIVILLRATRNTANTFIEEFKQAGIPAYADLSSGYFEATEVETVLSLLRVIDNPRQDIPLAALLRSPIVGLNAADLAAVRLRDRSADFYEAVKLSAQAGETPADLKLSMLLANLEKWRTVARRGSLAELIWQLYNETGYYVYVGGMPGGSQRQANLRALYDRARQYEATNFRGLFRFLRFIEKFQETGFDLGAARAIGENEDVVRIISIHKSKGLEFPVVFVAGMGKQFNTMDLKQKAVLHKELGLGLPVVDLNLGLTYPTIAHSAIGKRMHMELLAEEMRILYVALTRAREKLILVGSVRDLAKSAGRWCENVSCPAWELPDTILAGAKTYLDWIGPAIARHPGGQELRHLAGCETIPSAVTQNDPSSWIVSIAPDTEKDLAAPGVPVNQSHLLEYVGRGEPVPAEDNYFELLDLRLNWQYSWEGIVGKPAKATVTELKRRFAVEESGESDTTTVNTVYRPLKSVRPNFLRQDTGLSAAERGSVMHLFMQHLDFKLDLTRDILEHKITQMVHSELLTLEQADSVDIEAVMAFLASPLAKRITKAVQVRKELPFTMALPAGQVFSDVSGDFAEGVIVQGVLDCLVDEGDGFVLIDYKTDAVNEGNIQQAAARYSGQLNLYTRAVETILQKPVKEKYLYFFSLGREIQCS